MSPRSAFPDTEWEPTREYWAAAARGELAIPRCTVCRHYVCYPHPESRQCGSAELRWVAMSGRGRLFSWATVERALFEPFADKLPYVAGLVSLDEDARVRVVTNIVDCEPAELRVDMPVRVVFRDLTFSGSTRRVAAPCFAPASSAAPHAGRAA